MCLFVVCPSRSIKRIIFNSLVKPNVNEKGEKQMETISTSQALQIAGRAGRSVLHLLKPKRKRESFASEDPVLTSDALIQMMSFCHLPQVFIQV